MHNRNLILALMLGSMMLPHVALAEVTVPVRGGVHDRFNRMVLDWPVDVKYTMQQANGHVTIQFTQPAKVALGSFHAAAPPYIQNIQAQNNDKGLRLTFDIPDQSRVQAFWAGKKVAFDVLLMSKDKPTFSNQASKPEAPREQDAPPPAAEPVAGEQPAPQIKPIETSAAVKPMTTVGPQQPQALPTMPTLAEQMKLLEEANKAVPPPVMAPDEKTKESVAVDERGQEQDGTVVRFRLLKQTKLAAFVRAGRLWIVIDQAMKGVAPQIQGQLQRTLENASLIETPNGTAYIFELPDTIKEENITVRLDGLNWEVWFNNPDKKSPLVGNLALKARDEGKALILDPDQETHVLPFEDRMVGDKLWVVPVMSPLMHSEDAQELNSLSLMPTLVGGLLVPNQDMLNVVAKGNTLIFQDNDSSLLLSSMVDRLQAEQKPEKQKLFYVDVKDAALVKDIRESDRRNFERQRQELERQISFYKKPAERALRALDLVRLYLGQGFGNEAKGGLDLAQRELPNLNKTPDFMALQGMAYALSGNTDEAMTLLDDPEVRDAPMANLWRAYAQAQDKNWEKAYLIFKDMPEAFKVYPSRLNIRLLLAAAESAVETDHMEQADKFLKQIDQSEISLAQSWAQDYIRGVINLKSSNPNQGLNELTDVARSKDHYYRVKAELKIMEYETAEKNIEMKDAIERLEKLRFAWRGDRQEVIILRQLGQYYIKTGQTMEAMTMWQKAIDRSDNDKDLTALRRDLQNTFNTLFVDANTGDLTTIQVLAIYERFKTLMPEGEKGQQAAIHLSESLQKVDLMDQADKVLQDLLNNQATGADAVVVGTKLAALRLLDKNPTGALKALDESQNDAVPSAEVAGRRTLLRIRALADSQQTDKALAMLNDPKIPEGMSLRADLFWRLGRWSDAAYDLQTLIDSTTDKNPKNKTYTGLIMRLAIVKALQNDELGLAQMAAQYTDVMKDTPQNRAFAVMTQAAGDTALADLDTIKSQVAQVELFENFLKTF